MPPFQSFDLQIHFNFKSNTKIFAGVFFDYFYPWEMPSLECSWARKVSLLHFIHCIDGCCSRLVSLQISTESTVEQIQLAFELQIIINNEFTVRNSSWDVEIEGREWWGDSGVAFHSRDID